MFGIPAHRFMDCHARRIRPSGTLLEAKVCLSASFNVAMPLAPILPESSTETMTLGAGSRLLVPAGYCARGAREFCKQFNHDWSDFLDNGVDADILERTGDAMALKVVAAMRREQQ